MGTQRYRTRHPAAGGTISWCKDARHELVKWRRDVLRDTETPLLECASQCVCVDCVCACMCANSQTSVAGRTEIYTVAYLHNCYHSSVTGNRVLKQLSTKMSVDQKKNMF